MLSTSRRELLATSAASTAGLTALAARSAWAMRWYGTWADRLTGSRRTAHQAQSFTASKKKAV